MWDNRVFAICLVVISVSASAIPDRASAQECFPFPWLCPRSDPRAVEPQVQPGHRSNRATSLPLTSAVTTGNARHLRSRRRRTLPDPRRANVRGRSQLSARGRVVPLARGARHDHHRSARSLPLSRARQWPGDPLRHRSRAARFRLVRCRNHRDKQEWPDWYPPKEMIQRQPELKRQISTLRSGLGVAGGPGNPLGARAMYLWQGTRTRSTGSTARTNRRPSGRASRPAAFACSTRTSSTSTPAPRSAPKSWSCGRGLVKTTADTLRRTEAVRERPQTLLL